MSTVYIVCQPTNTDGSPKFDFSSALEYGVPEVLLSHSQSLLSPVPTVRILKEKLSTYDPDKDFILMIGDPSLCSTVAMVASTVGHGRVTLLKWDGRHKKYFPIHVDVTGRSL